MKHENRFIAGFFVLCDVGIYEIFGSDLTWGTD